MLKEIIEKDLGWLKKVKTKWSPPKGTFSDDKSPEETAKIVCKGHNGNLKSAVASVNFYYNRAGKSNDKKRTKIIDILQKICKKD